MTFGGQAAENGVVPKFVVKMAGKPETSFLFEEDDIFIGRVPTINDICVGDPSVSRQHVHIKKREEGYTLYDLKSLNGVLLNGTRVQRATLKHGDALRLGDVEIGVYLNEISSDEELTAIEQSEETQAQKHLGESNQHEVTQQVTVPSKESEFLGPVTPKNKKSN